MNFSVVHSVVLALLACVIPPYAFRLSRLFGTQRVGWVLVTVFSSLAALMLVRAWWQPFGLDSKLTLDLLNFLIPVLLGFNLMSDAVRRACPMPLIVTHAGATN